MSAELEQSRRLRQERELALRERNAAIAEQRLLQERQAIEQERHYMSPQKDMMSLSKVADKIDTNFGTEAGANSVVYGTDFTPPQYTQENYIQPQTFEQVSYVDEYAPDNLEKTPDFDGFMAEWNELRQLGQRLARIGVDVNKYYSDPEKNEANRQYREKLTRLKTQARRMQEGYKAQELRAKTNGLYAEQHQGPTQFSHLYRTKLYEDRANQINLKAKEMTSRGATRDANAMLFGLGGSQESARKNYTGAVGEFYREADELRRAGKVDEANKVELIAESILGAVHNTTYDDNRALEWAKHRLNKDKLAHEKAKAKAKGKEKEEKFIDLQRQASLIANQKDMSFVRERFPGAKFINEGGVEYLAFTTDKKGDYSVDEKDGNVHKVRLDNDEALLRVLAEGDKSLKLTEVLEFNRENRYEPLDTENYTVDYKGDNQASEYIKGIKSWPNDSEIEQASSLLQPYIPYLKIDGKSVQKIEKENSSSIFDGDNDLVVTFEDGKTINVPLDEEEGRDKIKAALAEINPDLAYNLIKEDESSFRDKEGIISSSQYKYSIGGHGKASKGKEEKDSGKMTKEKLNAALSKDTGE